MLDNRYLIETPEGIDLVLTPAGPLPRIFAWLIDGVLRLVLLFLCLLLFSLMGGLGDGLWLILLFLLEWLYPVMFEVLRGGRTPGKQLMSLRVVNDDGTPVDWGSSLTRNLLRAVDFLPLLYTTGLISMFCNRQFKRLGDFAAGTLVVYEQRPIKGKLISVSGSCPLPCKLHMDEQRALLDFAESGHRLSQARQQELANLLQPLTEVSDQAAVEKLVLYANGLSGR